MFSVREKNRRPPSPKTRIERLATYDWCFDEPDDWSVHIDAVDCSRTIDPATSRPYNKSVANNWREFYCDATKEPSLALLGGLHDCTSSGIRGTRAAMPRAAAADGIRR